jgi:hypothetical protein
VPDALIELLKAGDRHAVLDWVTRWDESCDKRIAKEPWKPRWTLRHRSSERRVLCQRWSWDEEEEAYRRAERSLAPPCQGEAAASETTPPGEGIFPSTVERCSNKGEAIRAIPSATEVEPTSRDQEVADRVSESLSKCSEGPKARAVKLVPRSSSVVMVSLSDSEGEYHEVAESQEDLDRIR